MSAKPSHRAYAAKRKGSAGPVRRRHKTGTLCAISIWVTNTSFNRGLSHEKSENRDYWRV